MKEYTDEELIEYFKELTIQSNEPNHQYRSVKYDKDINILNVYITFIKDEKYSEFIKKIVSLGFEGKIKFVLYKDKEEQHDRFDQFLKHLEKYEQEIGIEENQKLSPQEIQRKYDKYDELVEDLKKTNKQMVQFAEELKKLI